MKFTTAFLSLAAILGLAVTAAHAGLGDPKKLPPAAKKTVDFAKDIKPLLTKSCTSCHTEQDGKKPKGKYSMDSREKTIQGGSSGDAAIIPGNSAKSPMVHNMADLVKEEEMPPLDKRDKYPPLTKEQIGLIRAWIDQGAKW